MDVSSKEHIAYIQQKTSKVPNKRGLAPATARV